MKGYLLDTHALMWAINEPARLGGKAVEVLRDRGNLVVVSAVHGNCIPRTASGNCLERGRGWMLSRGTCDGSERSSCSSSGRTRA